MNDRSLEHDDVDIARKITGARDYLDACSRAIYDLDPERVALIADRLAHCAAAGHVILVAGNGGSHCTALHLATDLEKCLCAALPPARRTFPNVPRVRVLGENAGINTAWANDDQFVNALAWQVDAWSEAGGTLVLLSASGASPNLLRAADAAHARGLDVLALVGRAGSGLAAVADLALVVGTEDTQLAEDCHMVACHAIFRELLREIQARWIDRG